MFVSQFRQSLMAQLQIATGYSTAFHPQTNGQAKQTTTMLESYLRQFCNQRRDNSAKLTACTEISWSNSCPPPPVSLRSVWRKGSTPESMLLLTDRQRTATTRSLQAKISQSKNLNRLKGRLPSHKIGQWVWISRQNIKSRKASNKLDSKLVGPFQITRLIGTHAVELKLDAPFNKLHPVFNTNLIFPFFSDDT